MLSILGNSFLLLISWRVAKKQMRANQSNCDAVTQCAMYYTFVIRYIRGSSEPMSHGYMGSVTVLDLREAGDKTR